MHDITLIREAPAGFDAALARRGLPAQADTILDLDQRRRAAQTAAQQLLEERNSASKAIGAAKASKNETEAARLMERVAVLKEQLPGLEAEAEALGQALESLLSTLPNLPHASVPDGKDETANIEVSRWGTPRTFAFTPKPHEVLGENLGFLSAEKAASMSGARFTVLSGGLARLERALAQFMLDTHTQESGYTEISPPYLVRDHALYGTGQLPKFGDDLFRTTDDLWLIPTAEVSLTNLVREQILPATALPLRFVAHTPCFRSEAGSAGRDTSGILRQHQFHKVELVSITTPEASMTELERKTTAAERILQALELPYRKVLLCAGDMGFSAVKTYDLEVWVPAQNTYREISSCSNCGAFQARRMQARYRTTAESKAAFVHTLNGSGLAVGRTLLAVMENYQQADGSITIPTVLQPYMTGLTEIRTDTLA